MRLQRAAGRFLRGDIDAWMQFCGTYLRACFDWMAQDLNVTSQDVRLSACADELYALLLRPDLVRSIAEAKFDWLVNDILKKRTAAVLANSGVVAVTSGDLDSPLGYGWFESKVALRDEEDDVGLWASDKYPVKNLEIARFRAQFGDIRVKRKSSHAKNEEQSPSLLSLDVVDIALYKALTQHPDLLRTIPWRTFEKLLADILDSFGYEVELQQGTKDGGIDIFALKKNETFGIQRFLVQAKRWSNRVGVEPVRQLMFLHSHYRVTKSCLATTATFTKGAWELADQYQWQLELRDFDGIQEWLRLAAKNRRCATNGPELA